MWTPEPVWTLWSRETFLVGAENRTPAVQRVAIPVSVKVYSVYWFTSTCTFLFFMWELDLLSNSCH
jgi:hypothetical protein